MTLTVPNTGHW